MRSVLRLSVLALLFCLGVAHADDRADARAHYQAGQKAYTAGDYRAAIREFSAAQQLLPADLNNYNLALCYDKMGDAEPAIQYYRAFLDKNPGSDKKPEIDASIARLEAASKSVHAKADAAAKAKADDDAKLAAKAKADEDARRADEVRRADDARRMQPPPGPAPAGPAPAGPETYAMGSQGTPGSSQIVSTGDAQLDRVQQIDINRVRDERYGDQGPPRTGGVAQPGVAQQGTPDRPQSLGPTGQQTPPPPPGPGVAQSPMPANVPEQPHKETPLYKKWWFWGIIAVSAVVVIEIAASGGSSDNNTRLSREAPTGSSPAAVHGGGLTLLRF